MLPRPAATAILCALLVVSRAPADEPNRPAAAPRPVPMLPPGFDPDRLADPREAARAADWLEKAYPGRQPAAVRMLVAILRGSQMGPQDGWFGPAETRYTWDWLAARHGADPKTGGVAREQFRGPPAHFDRLDRDGDGQVTAGDLDWSDRSPYVQQANYVNRLFRRMDAGGDGRLTREEVDEFFRQAARGQDHITPDGFRQALLPRGPGGFQPGDAPAVSVLVRGLLAGEIGSAEEGPRVGEAAPAFALKMADGAGTVRLQDLLGRKPAVLVFGNFTCGPFRSLYPDVDAVYERYRGEAGFLMVYVREAHPTDGWRMESNARARVAVRQPTTLAERVKVCDQFCQLLRPAMPVVVDELDDPAGHAYSGMPARLYVIDARGRVAYKSGRGPFGFRVGEMEQALVMNLLEVGPAGKP